MTNNSQKYLLNCTKRWIWNNASVGSLHRVKLNIHHSTPKHDLGTQMRDLLHQQTCKVLLSKWRCKIPLALTSYGVDIAILRPCETSRLELTTINKVGASSYIFVDSFFILKMSGQLSSCFATVSIDGLSYMPPEHASDSAESTIAYAATGRKTWKRLRQDQEAVWPPLIEGALLEGLFAFLLTTLHIDASIRFRKISPHDFARTKILAALSNA